MRQNRDEDALTVFTEMLNEEPHLGNIEKRKVNRVWFSKPGKSCGKYPPHKERFTSKCARLSNFTGLNSVLIMKANFPVILYLRKSSQLFPGFLKNQTRFTFLFDITQVKVPSLKHFGE